MPHTTFSQSGETFVRKWLDGFTSRFWFDDPSGALHSGTLHVVALIATFCVIALVIALLIRPLLDRMFVLAVVGCAVLTTGELLRLAWPVYRSSFWLGASQGRYLFALVGGLGLLIAFGLGSVSHDSERWVPRIAVGVALLLNIVAALDTARWYWLPEPGAGNRAWRAVQNLFYVSAMPPWLLAPLVVVVVGLTAATVWVVWAPEGSHRVFDRWTGGPRRFFDGQSREPELSPELASV